MVGNEDFVDVYNGYFPYRTFEWFINRPWLKDVDVIELEFDGSKRDRDSCGKEFVEIQLDNNKSFTIEKQIENKWRFRFMPGTGGYKDSAGINLVDMFAKLKKFDPSTLFIVSMKIRFGDYTSGLFFKSKFITDEEMRKRIPRTKNARQNALVLQDFVNYDELVKIKKMFGKHFRIVRGYETDEKSIAWKEVN